ncbi:MAG: NAD+ synthase, partial [Burkholderiales bacterium]|nr:NAD+ synthase [Burkholderiales bacterium]
MRVALAQIDCVLGDIAGNAARVLDACQRARAAGAGIVLTPELSICGYPPEDLLLRPDFVADCERAVAELATRSRGLVVVVGHPRRHAGRLFNAASVLRDGHVIATYHKRDLPNYTVFDEVRYFDRGDAPCVFEHDGVRFGVVICEDIWGPDGPKTARDRGGATLDDPAPRPDGVDPDAPQLARAAGAQVLLVLNASPYHLEKQGTRHGVVQARARETGMAVLFCNLVGGQDELVFDGASFVVDARGAVTHELPAFDEALGMVDLDGGAHVIPGERVPPLSTDASVYRALCLGVRDYIGKNGFPGALLGLSGG